MSEIGIDKFTDDELGLLENAYGTSSHGHEIKRLVAEIRRQRAENAELRDSYERVEKHAQSLAEENAGMNSKLNRLADKGLCQGCEPVCRNCSQDECDLAKERTPLP